MASYDKPEVVERDVTDKEHEEDDKPIVVKRDAKDKEHKEDDKPEVAEKDVKDKEHKEDDKEEGKGGFLEKVKDFIHDIGEKIEGAIGFGKPTADVTGLHVNSINLVDDIKNTYADIKLGSIIPYRIKVDILVDVPIFGRITLPLEKTGEIPIPYKPDIDIQKIKFDRFSFEETVAILHLKLENKNDFDLGLNDLDYEVWLSDESIGSVDLQKSANLVKNGIFRPKNFGSALWDMIGGNGTGYSMKGNIN